MTDAEFTEALHEAFLVGFMASDDDWNGDALCEAEQDGLAEMMQDLEGYFTHWIAELILYEVAA